MYAGVNSSDLLCRIVFRVLKVRVLLVARGTRIRIVLRISIRIVRIFSFLINFQFFTLLIKTCTFSIRKFCFSRCVTGIFRTGCAILVYFIFGIGNTYADENARIKESPTGKKILVEEIGGRKSYYTHEQQLYQ